MKKRFKEVLLYILVLSCIFSYDFAEAAKNSSASNPYEEAPKSNDASNPYEEVPKESTGSGDKGAVIVTSTPDDAKTKNNGEFFSGNDGKARKKDDIFKDSGLASSFKNVEYYDVALPYELTCNDIGGYSPNMSEGVRKSHISRQVARESEWNWWFYDAKKSPVDGLMFNGATSNGKLDIKLDKKTGLNTVTNNGVTFYLMAVQGYFFSNGKAMKDGFPGFSSSGWGQLIDVILTDGTVIHFVYTDSNAEPHTNGGTKELKKTLKMNQYRCLFAFQNGNCIELWGESKSGEKVPSDFRKRFGLDKDVSIAYYRMYKKKIGDKFEAVSEDAKNVTYKLTESGNSPEAVEKNKKNGAVGSNGFYSEAALSTWNKLVEKNLEKELINTATRDNLYGDRLDSLSDWEFDLQSTEQEHGVIYFVRKSVVLFGILFTLWTLLLYVAFWFDRINNFVDISFLSILTFGKLRVSDTDDECTYGSKEGDKVKTVNHRTILFMCTLSLIFSALVLSGTFFSWVMALIVNITNWLNSIF